MIDDLGNELRDEVMANEPERVGTTLVRELIRVLPEKERREFLGYLAKRKMEEFDRDYRKD